ncbi:hypothetical protein FNV43_RR02351 [Rhamnella rubrinervis]|uniref:Uncharacterized protein n=1 Tax=Rhamnella rubrinervis TaxID=2594499 RepID=A0A8K0HTI8_9ROSA|nr:hypothetical protein FNV43_RR02351 [Rhamnella rubrinervis]
MARFLKLLVPAAFFLILIYVFAVDAFDTVDKHAIIGVLRHHTRSHVYSFATSAVQSVCVFHQALMAIRRNALATTIGKLRKGVLSALNYCLRK